MGQPNEQGEKLEPRREGGADRRVGGASKEAHEGKAGFNAEQTAKAREQMKLRTNGQPTGSGTGDKFGVPEITDGAGGSLVRGRAPTKAESVDKPHEKPKSKDGADKPNEKLLPKDGDNIPLKTFLNDYDSPIMKQYELSKQLNDGAPGKSQILERVVERIRDCPWNDKIRIHFDSKASNPEYSDATSTITLNPNESSWNQIRTFAHEGYHAGHQTMQQLYGGDKAVSPKEFEKILNTREANAFASEVLLYSELKNVSLADGQPVNPPRFRHVPDGLFAHSEHKDLAELYDKKGFEGLKDFVLDAKPPKIEHGHNVTDNFQQTLTGETYRQDYQRIYSQYAESFDKAKEGVNDIIKQYEHKHPGKVFDY